MNIRNMLRRAALPVTALLAMVAVPVQAQTAQTNPPSTGERIRDILGQILGNRNSTDNSGLNAQWAAGRRPLAERQIQFEQQVDEEVRNRQLSFNDGERLKMDYRSLVNLEARYASDGQINSNERSDLSRRYTELTEALRRGSYQGAGGGYPDNGSYYPGTGGARIAQGEAEFARRVDVQVSNRRLSRTEGNRLRSDYAALVRTEESYLRDGYLSDRERAELDNRLAALEQRLGDGGYGGYTSTGGYGSARDRLDAVSRALPSSGLSSSARAQLSVELGDLMRLADAYDRGNPSSDDRAYLERRVYDLESRVRIRR